ncbi:MAG: ATP-dependent helicase, partial [Planctomycetes bacterium]|nr:ATP-dependent helicase [Planctomycetota bacterium]
IQLIGEGFDCPNLSSLVLTTPIKYSGRLIQVVGRILRPAAGKKPVIYDFIDHQVGVLRASAQSRNRVYADMAA